MSKTANAKVLARRKLEEQERARRELILEEAVSAMSAAGVLRSLRAQVVTKESELRGHLEALVAAGKSVEEIAELTELPVEDVTSALRKRPARRDADVVELPTGEA